MRAREFITELRLDIPDQMVTVQVPLSQIQRQNDGLGDEEEVRNPGRRIDSLGRHKWSPPLQQHLDAAKDAIGPSDQATDLDPEPGSPEADQHSPHDQEPEQGLPFPAHQAPPDNQSSPLPAVRKISTLARSTGPLG